MDAMILQKLIDLAMEEPRSYVKVDVGIWHGDSPTINVQIHYMRDPGAITGLGKSVDEAYTDLMRNMKTGYES